MLFASNNNKAVVLPGGGQRIRSPFVDAQVVVDWLAGDLVFGRRKRASGQTIGRKKAKTHQPFGKKKAKDVPPSTIPGQ